MKEIIQRYIIIICFCPFVRCNTSENENIDKHSLLQSPLPKEVLDTYLSKIHLKDLSAGVDSFEMRLWSPFFYSDSFPLSLMRVYFSPKKLNAECYFFSDNNGGLVTSAIEIDKLNIEKFTVRGVPLNLLDSLQTYYSFSNIDTFDTDIIRRKIESGFTTATARYTLFEQASKGKYHVAFFSDPEYFPGLHRNIDRYGIASKFIKELLFRVDSLFKNWYIETGKKILSKQ